MPRYLRRKLDSYFLSWFALVTASLFFGACKKPDPWKIVTPKDLEAPDSAPVITQIEDIGAAVVTAGLPLKPRAGDAIAVPGELIVIRGKHLGRQPSVMIGVKPVSVLARLADGAIVVRVPPGVRSGDLPVTVTQRKGSRRHTLTIQRHGLAVSPDGKKVHVLKIGAHTAELARRTINVPDVRAMLPHPLGGVIYLLSGSPNASVELHSIDMAAKGGPKIVSSTKRGMTPDADQTFFGLSVATEKALVTSAVGDSITMWDAETPTKPSVWHSIEIPPKLGKQEITDMAISPDGKTLAVLFADVNSVVLADVTDPLRVRWTKPTLVHSGENTPPLVRRLSFHQEDISPTRSVQALWVLSGDNRKSLQVGRHPTHATRYEVTSAQSGDTLPQLKKTKQFSINPSPAIHDWAATFNPQQVQSGTSLRQDPSRMVFYVTGIDPEIFTLPQPLDSPTGRQHAVEFFEKGISLGTIISVDPQGRLQPKLRLSKRMIMGDLVVTTDGTLLLTTACKAQKTQKTPQKAPNERPPEEKTKETKDEPTLSLKCGILTVEIKTNKTNFISLTQSSLNKLKRPEAFGLVTVQP
jgi:hypothetical protein